MTSLGILTVSDGGEVRLRVPVDPHSFMLLPQLTRGVGSSAIHLDRGQPGSMRHVQWVRDGVSMRLVQLNTHFISSTRPSPTVSDSFATSVLHRTKIIDEDETGALIDITALALQDLVGIGRWFAIAQAGHVSVDAARSGIRTAECRSHGAGLELSADLTVRGAIGAAVELVAPDPDAVTVTQRLTMLPLPTPPMPGRRYTPVSGGYGKRFADFSLPQDSVQDSGWLPRFRLDPIGESEAGIAVERPIVFSIDPDIAEPWRSAVCDGANWWAEGFRAAGFADAFRAEVRPPDIDPAAAGVNPVWWVHRSGRGWSMGAALTDPRSGEILKGNVRLGSQRVQQLTQLGEALLTPYGREDEAERLASIRAMVLARIRQLAAHEVGHALGFMHNYSSHRHSSPSVMDYPHPVIRLDADGRIDLSGAYAVGLSAWDVYSVRASYEIAPDGDDAALLQALRAEMNADDLAYLTDDDGHGVSASAPGAVPWISGAEPLRALEEIIAVREVALAEFGVGAVPPGSQTGEVERRFALVHLLHRYHLGAVARLLGGVDYRYGDAHDPETAPVPVSASTQRDALARLTALLDPGILRVPSHVVATIAPPSIRYARSGADFGTTLGALFDSISAAAAAAEIVTAQLFEPARLNRALLHHAENPDCPGPEDYVVGAFARLSGPASAHLAGVDALVAEVARSVLVRSIVTALRSGQLHAPCASSVRRAVAAASETLPEGERTELQALLADASRDFPWPATVVPDGVPI